MSTRWLEGLAGVLLGAGLLMPELGRFSKHLSGEVFDVQPVDRDAVAINVRAPAGLGKFLDTEGGLVLWHAQF